MTTTVYTDDELEAMAARLDHGFDTLSEAEGAMEDAAAMLRACKGRVKRLPRTDGEGGWTLPVELLAEIRDEVYAKKWDAPCAEVIEIIALSTEARILAALDADPDHGEWNAAIEAAAKVVEVCDWGHHWNLDGEYVDPSDLSDAIRAIKKGQTND